MFLELVDEVLCRSKISPGLIGLIFQTLKRALFDRHQTGAADSRFPLLLQQMRCQQMPCQKMRCQMSFVRFPILVIFSALLKFCWRVSKLAPVTRLASMPKHRFCSKITRSGAGASLCCNMDVSSATILFYIRVDGPARFQRCGIKMYRFTIN